MEELTPTKEEPGPFDGMEAAKLGEPVFTLQGGDPLGARLVRLWALGARIRCGLVKVENWTGDAVFGEFLDAAIASPVEPQKKEALQLKATEAEGVSWDMDVYRRNEKPPEKKEDRYSGWQETEKTRAQLDEHRERVEIGRELNDATGTINDQAERLRKYGLESEARELLRIVETLKVISDRARPQRRGGPAYD